MVAASCSTVAACSVAPCESACAPLETEMANGNFDVRTRAEERYVGSFQSLLISIRKLNRDLSSTLGQNANIFV